MGGGGGIQSSCMKRRFGIGQVYIKSIQTDIPFRQLKVTGVNRLHKVTGVNRLLKVTGVNCTVPTTKVSDGVSRTTVRTFGAIVMSVLCYYRRSARMTLKA